ncbi:MAG: VTT domain-containing protein [Firmicutes bacterium]|nr:VTT domain-containing protein [Bacillota bacterium]
MEDRNKIKKISAAVKLLLLFIILIGLPLYIYFCHHDIIDKFSDITYCEQLLSEYKTQSIPIYLGIQVLQIVICILPGQAIQLAGGYMYGFWLGYLLSIAGTFVGTVLTYYIAEILGHNAMAVLFGQDKMDSFADKLKGKKGIATMIILFIIPGFPKDILTYAAGISELSLKWLLIISLICRTPAMMGSLLIGHQLVKGYYTSAIVIAIIAAILFILGIIFKNKVMYLFDKIYDKTIGKGDN